MISLPISLLVLIPLWRLFDRAGLSPLWSLLVLIPGIGLLIAPAILAFASWPKGEARR